MAKRQPNRSTRSQSQSIQAPLGGMNDRDPLANMPKSDAILLENFFPDANSCDIRGGVSQWANGDLGISAQSTSRTLMVYNGISASNMFLCINSNIYDVSSAGSIGAAVVSSFNSKIDYVNFGGASGNFLVCVNGAQLPQFYNGSAWTPSGTGYATAITGVTASTFNQVNVWKNRLFFVEKNTLNCWYLGTNAIGGAANSLNFAGQARLGGHLVATATVTSSAANQLDDYFVAITNKGEAIVYRGTDPSSASTFAIVGNYFIGEPLANGITEEGGRWICKFSSDMLALTSAGVVTMQSALSNDVIAQRTTINDKVSTGITRAIELYRNNLGWSLTLAPKNNKLIVNVPIVATAGSIKSEQYVMNTSTGAWCKWTGLNASCFAYYKNELYAGINNHVYKVDVKGANDVIQIYSQEGHIPGAIVEVWTMTDQPIQAEVKTAFQYFGDRGHIKSFKMVRPTFKLSANTIPMINLDVDFKSSTLTAIKDVSVRNNSLWDVGLWDVARWSQEYIDFNDWIGVNGEGYCGSLHMRIASNNQTCEWFDWTVMYERGGLL